MSQERDRLEICFRELSEISLSALLRNDELQQIGQLPIFGILVANYKTKKLLSQKIWSTLESIVTDTSSSDTTQPKIASDTNPGDALVLSISSPLLIHHLLSRSFFRPFFSTLMIENFERREPTPTYIWMTKDNINNSTDSSSIDNDTDHRLRLICIISTQR